MRRECLQARLYQPRAKNRVSVEMKTSGRMDGMTWLLDPDAIVK
ncbi:MAG: hypothetical protein ACXWJW_15715 [Xanthobacteraceae bacterium]